MSAKITDWNPETYARFRGLRLRPAIDLLAQIGEVPQGDVVDLGCGDGAVAAALAQRFTGRRLIGVDASHSMLAKALAANIYSETVQADIGPWQPARPPAVIFSNAALHWLPDHAQLLPRLAQSLVAGGVLAVQMPRQFNAPSHRFLRDIAATMFPDRFNFLHYTPPTAKAEDYHAMLQPFGMVSVWETEYIQRLDPEDAMHPVHAFTASTAMRPFVDGLNDAEQAQYCAAYDQALHAAYPLQTDGSVLFAFKRVFFVLKV